MGLGSSGRRLRRTCFCRDAWQWCAKQFPLVQSCARIINTVVLARALKTAQSTSQSMPAQVAGESRGPGSMTVMAA